MGAVPLAPLNFSTGGVHCINLYQLNQIIYHLLIQRIVSVGGFCFAQKRLETSGFREERETLVSVLWQFAGKIFRAKEGNEIPLRNK